MIHRSLGAVVLGLLVIGAPCLAADIIPTPNSNSKKPAPKTVPSGPISSPTHSSKTHHTRQSYHPHQAKPGDKQAKPLSPRRS